MELDTSTRESLMNPNRRWFLKTAAAGAAALLPVSRADASGAQGTIDSGRRGVLVDTTRCVGCRACEAACAETNALPDPVSPGDDHVFDKPRTTSTRAFTVVNAVGQSADAEARFVKRQCMHCLEPACASACLVRALDKTPTGPVVYHKERCLGCRYCLVACPFGVPKYEYESPSPYVRKCTFCADRQAGGRGPACTTVCPSGALTFGNRLELIDEAKERIYAPGSTYVRHIYGETEVGGTSWLYITDLPMDRLGLPQVGQYAYSSLAQASLAAVPFVLTLWPPLLMGLYKFSQSRTAAAGVSTTDDVSEANHE
jgi:formate dehydrogenase iron-sulfur subunit